VPDAPTDRSEPVLETQLVAPTVLAPAAAPAFTVGGVLSRTMKVWGAHFWSFAAMSLVVYAPMIAGFGTFFAWVMGASEGRAPEPAELATGGAAVAAGSAVTIVLSVVQMGAVTYGTVRHLHGERAPFGRMVAVGFRRGLPVVGTGFVVWLGTVAGIVLLFVPGILFLVASCVAVPAAVVERPGVFGSIGRSFALTRGSRWPLFAAGLVIVVVVWILSSVLQIGSLLLGAVVPPPYLLVVSLVASQVGNALFSVVPVVAIAVCYHDLRLQKEGVDTADLARVFE
jgi:hypothetical protein